MLDNLTRNSEALRAQTTREDEAREALLAAETEVVALLAATALGGTLDAVLGAARPCIRIVTSWPDGVGSVTRRKHRAGHIGIRVTGDGPEEDYPRANHGSYAGTDLWLLADGKWLELDWGGHWSRWQGATSKAVAEQEILTDREVADRYEIQAVVEALAERYAKAKPEKTEEIRAQAERMRAAVAVLRGE